MPLVLCRRHHIINSLCLSPNIPFGTMHQCPIEREHVPPIHAKRKAMIIFYFIDDVAACVIWFKYRLSFCILLPLCKLWEHFIPPFQVLGTIWYCFYDFAWTVIVALNRWSRASFFLWMKSFAFNWHTSEWSTHNAQIVWCVVSMQRHGKLWENSSSLISTQTQ